MFFFVNFVNLLKFDISIIILKNIYTTFKNDMFVCCQTRIYKDWLPIYLKETNNYARSRV
jgi:hypothetical protein